MSTLQERLRGGEMSPALWDRAADRIDADAERIKELEAEVAARLVDAERWRHWRKHHHCQALQSFGYTESEVEHWTNERNKQLLDAAIDAARSKT